MTHSLLLGTRLTYLIVLLTVVTLSGVLVFKVAHGKRREAGVGETFHQETRLTLTGMIGSIFQWRTQPSQYKYYPGKEKIKLPTPAFKGLPLEDCIQQRRSVREYSGKPMSIEELSQLIHAASGITGYLDADTPLRSAPSAGALYPIELYVVVNNVQNLGRGLYHYCILDHSLELVKAGDFRDEITGCALDQEMAGEANVTFVLTAVFGRSTYKYDERGYRYAYMEAGHISQNIYLEAVSLGLGSVAIGAFYDDRLNEFLGVDGGQEAALYMHAVGRP